MRHTLEAARTQAVRHLDAQISAAWVLPIEDSVLLNRSNSWLNRSNAMTRPTVLARMGNVLPDLETLYEDIHSHPELSMQETRTAGIVADWLQRAGYQVTLPLGRLGGGWRHCALRRAMRSTPCSLALAMVGPLPSLVHVGCFRRWGTGSRRSNA